MANLNNNRTLFATTSPRTPSLMIPDLKLLSDNFTGQVWNKQTQTSFMRLLTQVDDKKGENLNKANIDLAARDRINRSPKAFGFVRLKPTIELTPAGSALLQTRRTDEIFLRQFLKYQLPSPFHKQTAQNGRFRIKPYLELFRMIRELGSMKFDEMRLYGLQLTDYRDFDRIVNKVRAFRKEKANHVGRYKAFLQSTIEKVIRELYSEEIASGHTRTRESSDASVQAFIAKKARNMRDYADAIFRHLRATELVEISQSGRSISITAGREAEVDFIFNTISREPADFANEADYIAYLGDISQPILLLDDRNLLAQLLHNEFGITVSDAMELWQIKDVLAEAREKRKEGLLKQYITRLKQHQEYDDVVTTFQGIKDKTYYDCPLMLEWNTWRAMTMLNGGSIRANLKFDDSGLPVSTALGNAPDIECDYGTFGLTVEVTLTSGQRQFFTECEPVPRHLGRFKEGMKGRQVYSLFIAPKINDATVAHFFSLRRLKMDYYGGDTIIIPMQLDTFEHMVENSHNAEQTPAPFQVEAFFKKAISIADEQEGGDAHVKWYNKVIELANNWPSYA